MNKPPSVAREFLDSEFSGNFNQLSLEANFIEPAEATSLLTMPIWLTVVFPQNEEVKVAVCAGLTPPERASHVNTRLPGSNRLCGAQSSAKIFDLLYGLGSPIKKLPHSSPPIQKYY